MVRLIVRASDQAQGGRAVLGDGVRRATKWAAILLTSTVVAALLAGAGGLLYIQEHNQAADSCQFESGKPQGARGSRIRWDWTPPGFVCVYTDRQSRVVGERRP